MDGQADSAPGTGGLMDLAKFVGELPDEDSPQDDEVADTESEESTQTGTDDAENDEQQASAEDSEESEEEGEEKPASVEKITFTVKGEDGKEETVEATTEEIAASYMRQADYTRKTQALAEREREAVQLFTQKYDEIRNDYLSKAEMARAAVLQVAGLKSEDEMAQLAHSDPAAWVAENQKRTAVASFLNSLDQQIASEREQQQAQQAQMQRQMLAQAYQTAWAELQKDGIDRDKLASVYDKGMKLYGFTPEELSNVYDARMVRVLRDAAAYRELQSKKQEVTKKVTEAPKIPSKSNAPASDRKAKALDQRFRTGKAKLNDLASLLR